MTNPKIKPVKAKSPMILKKPTEVSDKELFTDLSYPSGFMILLIHQIKFLKLILETCQISYSNTKLRPCTNKFKRILIVDSGLFRQCLIPYPSI